MIAYRFIVAHASTECNAFLMQVDAKLNIISSCNYDGSDRKVILYSTDYLRHPFSITTFEDYVYWTDWDRAAVFRANKFTGDDIKAITPPRMVSLLRKFTVLQHTI